MSHTMAAALRSNFLGNSPDWYKVLILGFLILNPVLVSFDPHLASWVLVGEFIFTLGSHWSDRCHSCSCDDSQNHNGGDNF